MGLLVVHLWWKRSYRRATILVGLTLISLTPYVMTTTLELWPVRSIPDSTAGMDRLSSGRIGLWQEAWAAFTEKPLVGWGFDGFGIGSAYLRATSQSDGVRSMQMLSSTAIFEDGSGDSWSVVPPSQKAHNIVLDLLVSHGIVGAAFYAVSWISAVVLLCFSRWRALAVAVVVYAVYLVTWYDMAQYAHVAWWALSIGVSTDMVREVSNERSAQPAESGVDTPKA